MNGDSKTFPQGACFRFFLVYGALFVPYSIITPYFQQLLGYLQFSKSQIGYIQGALELMAVLAPIAWGMLTDRLGASKSVLALTVFLCAPSFLLFRFINGTLAAICVALLFGLFFKPSIPLTDGMTFRYINTYGGDYGKVRIGGTAGYLVFIAVFDLFFWLMGGVTPGRIMAMFVVGIAVQMMSMCVIPKGCEAPKTLVKREKLPLRKLLPPVFLLVVLVAFLGRFAMMSYYSFFSRYLTEVYGVERVGYLWALGSICEIPLVFYSQRIMQKIGVKYLLVLGMLGIVIRLAGFSFESNLLMVSCMQPLHMLTFGAYHCSTLAYVGKLFPASMQGSAQGIFSAVTIGLGGLLGSAVGGIVLEGYGYKWMYLSYSAVALAGLLILLIFVPNVKDEGVKTLDEQR